MHELFICDSRCQIVNDLLTHLKRPSQLIIHMFSFRLSIGAQKCPWSKSPTQQSNFKHSLKTTWFHNTMRYEVVEACLSTSSLNFNMENLNLDHQDFNMEHWRYEWSTHLSTKCAPMAPVQNAYLTEYYRSVNRLQEHTPKNKEEERKKQRFAHYRRW